MLWEHSRVQSVLSMPPNARAHREPPNRVPSVRTEPQPGGDAVAHRVGHHAENALTFLNGLESSRSVKALRTYPMPVPFEKADAPERHLI